LAETESTICFAEFGGAARDGRAVARGGRGGGAREAARVTSQLGVRRFINGAGVTRR
jgi:hypothetical protein